MQGGLDDESFESYKSGLTAKLLEKDPCLSYETNRFWNQIVDNRYYLYMIFVGLSIIFNFPIAGDRGDAKILIVSNK